VSGEQLQYRLYRFARLFSAGRGRLAIALGAVLALAPLLAGPAYRAAVAPLPYFPRYAHQAYGLSLVLANVDRQAEARAWLDAADRALLKPDAARLPWSTEAELPPEPSALGYAFSVPEARKLRVVARLEGSGAAPLFVDLFRRGDSRAERVAGALPGERLVELEIGVLDAGDYVLRVQSELAAAGVVFVEVSAAPLLAFPVQGATPRAIWSGFGAERDGGRRAHRGVDIFAARGTPVLAAADGWVTRVETTRIGGNVVWMQPLYGNMRLYYAHLDEQLVERGDFVSAGEPVGRVGNTGNASTTPPHLHFGVYVRQSGRRGGARDPAAFLR
jgi:murein DD-endopeptidase MepM/ murein hydrolase activator NlpD